MTRSITKGISSLISFIGYILIIIGAGVVIVEPNNYGSFWSWILGGGISLAGLLVVMGK